MYTYLLGMLLGILYLLVRYTYDGDQLVVSVDAKKSIAHGHIQHVIDVRTPAEYHIGHYPRSKHIPVHLISKKALKAFGVEKNDHVIVYCNTGQRARFAAEKMKRLGYTKVQYIAGSYKGLQ